MRLAAAFLALVLGQDPAPKADPVYGFSAEQGWLLAVEGDRELGATTERELALGLQPNLRFTQNAPGTIPSPSPTPPKPQPRAPAPKPPASGPVTYRRLQGEPLKVEGTLTLRADDTVSLSFHKIQYSDSGQRWSIETDRDKVRTLDLGGQARWTGTRAEWLARLEAIEKAHVENYLRVVTPQRPEENRSAIGLAPAAQEAGRRLYVTACLEEQLALLLLARLEGAPLGKKLWPAEAAKYPPAAISAARALVDRLRLQATGAIAPAKARTARGAAVKDQPWDGQGPSIPAFGWPEGASWAAELARPFQEARRRLEELAAQTRVGGIDPTAWDAAVRAEWMKLEEASRVALPARPPGPQDPLLTPRAVAPGRATYDFKEDLDLKDGQVAASQIESLGLVREMEVAYFMSGPNRWRSARIRVEALYKGQVKRAP
jgi:hypothetical protein